MQKARASQPAIVTAIGIAMAFFLADSSGGTGAGDVPSSSTDKAFLDENALVMKQMMTDMDIRPSGDVDHDFVAMMVPHHQGAIDMARALLKYGKNEQLRRLAQEIIVTQQQEIDAMQRAVDQPSAPRAGERAGNSAKASASREQMRG